MTRQYIDMESGAENDVRVLSDRCDPPKKLAGRLRMPLLALLIAAWAHTVQPATAQSFGYNTLPAHSGVHGTRPVLLVLVEYQDVSFRLPHTQAYFETLLFTGPDALPAFFSNNSRGTFTFNHAGTLRVRHPRALACAHRWSFCPRTVGGWGTDIAVAPNGDIWIINSGREIWRHSAGRWDRMPGAAKHIDIGPGGSVFIIGTDADVPAPNGRVYRWSGSRWERFGGYGTRIAVGPSDHPWLVNDGNEVWHHDGRWEKLAGASARDIDVGQDGSVYLIGTVGTAPTGGIYRWTGSEMRSEGHSGNRIIVDPEGNPWTIAEGGAIWRRQNGEWGLWGGNARAFHIAADGQVAFLDVDSMGAWGTDGTVKRWAYKYNESGIHEYAYKEALERLDASALNLGRYDTNGDGRLSDTELPIVLVNALPPRGPRNPFGSNGGINRTLPACTRIGGTSLDVCPDAKVGVAGESTGFGTIAHELTHTLGAIDLYGADQQRSVGLTLMGATVLPDDVHEYLHLDPWHKMRFGWLQPRIVDIASLTSTQDALLSPPSTNGYSTILFHDSRRGVRDYLLVEYRRNDGLDRHVADVGVAIWQVHADDAWNPIAMPAQVGNGSDVTMMHLGAPGSAIRGGSRLWRPEDGEVRLPWFDGSDSGLWLLVTASGGATAQVRWRSRLSSFLVDVNTYTFAPQPIGPLCPSNLLRGDREFNGNGPSVVANASLVIGADGTTLNVVNFMRAIETGGDRSEATGRWERVVARVPAATGFRIGDVLTESSSWTAGTSDSAGTVNRWPVNGRLVSSFAIVGDTDGGDISNDTDCNDDTRMTLDFNFIKIRYERR